MDYHESLGWKKLKLRLMRFPTSIQATLSFANKAEDDDLEQYYYEQAFEDIASMRRLEEFYQIGEQTCLNHPSLAYSSLSVSSGPFKDWVSLLDVNSTATPSPSTSPSAQ